MIDRKAEQSEGVGKKTTSEKRSDRKRKKNEVKPRKVTKY